MPFEKIAISQDADPTLKSANRLEAIRELLGPHFAVLAGAGISYESGLPLANTVARHLINALGLRDFEMEELIAALSPDHHTNFGWHSYLRFEDIFQAIQRHHDPTLKLLDEMYSSGTPTQLHYALASHLGNKNPIFTTNFDTLLEQAAPNVPVLIHGSDYASYIRVSYFRYGGNPNYEVDVSSSFIGKLHGSVGTMNSVSGVPCATVTKILSDFAANKSKWNVVAGILRSMPLVIIGYSGGDDFDIMYVLRQVASQHPIVWINHSNDTDQIEVANWNEANSMSLSQAAKIMTNKFRSFLHDGFNLRYAPCRNLNQCYIVCGNTKKILGTLGMPIPFTENRSDHQVHLPELNIERDAAHLISAELFSRLSYGSWALKHIGESSLSKALQPRGVLERLQVLKKARNDSANSRAYVRAREIVAQTLFDMLELDRAEDAYADCVSKVSEEESIEYLLRLAEVDAFRFICHEPLHRIGLRLPHRSECFQQLQRRDQKIETLLDRLEHNHSHGETTKWARRRLYALRLIEKNWDKKVESLPILLSELSLESGAVILDPFVLAIVYLVYWHSTPYHQRSEQELKTDSFYEYVMKADLIPVMYPESIYGDAVARLPRTSQWREETWTPIMEPLHALYYSGIILGFTDNHPWHLANHLLLWEDEFSGFWREWSHSTAYAIWLPLHKAHAYSMSILVGRFLPVSEEEAIEFGTDAEETFKALTIYAQEDLPTISKFHHFDLRTLKCFRDHVGDKEFKRYMRTMAENYEAYRRAQAQDNDQTSGV